MPRSTRPMIVPARSSNFCSHVDRVPAPFRKAAVAGEASWPNTIQQCKPFYMRVLGSINPFYYHILVGIHHSYQTKSV